RCRWCSAIEPSRTAFINRLTRQLRTGLLGYGLGCRGCALAIVGNVLLEFLPRLSSDTYLERSDLHAVQTTGDVPELGVVASGADRRGFLALLFHHGRCNAFSNLV